VGEVVALLAGGRPSGSEELGRRLLDGVTLELRPTAAGQVGFFPEHPLAWPWLREQVADRPASEVLHLFAHTGATTLALAAVGAKVTHVDASRPAVVWARRNAELSRLADRPVRWIVDDALTYVRREERRGRRYAGIVLDPPTFGHVDIIGRAAPLFDQVTVAVLVNEGKVGLFTVEERIEMLPDVVADLDNVVVDSFSGLLVDFCVAHEIAAIVKGLRAVSDFDYELQMAQMNQQLAGIETVFVPTSPEWSFLASSLVKEVARLGGDVAALVPPGVLVRLQDRLAEHRDGHT